MHCPLYSTGNLVLAHHGPGIESLDANDTEVSLRVLSACCSRGYKSTALTFTDSVSGVTNERFSFIFQASGMLAY